MQVHAVVCGIGCRVVRRLQGISQRVFGVCWQPGVGQRSRRRLSALGRHQPLADGRLRQAWPRLAVAQRATTGAAGFVQWQGHGIAPEAFLHHETLGGVDQFFQVLHPVGTVSIGFEMRQQT